MLKLKPTRWLSLASWTLLATALLAADSGTAAAQDGTGVRRVRARYFNPFSRVASSRITVSPFGLPQFKAPLSAPQAAAAQPVAAVATADVSSESVALPAVGRPPFRPRPRSPFRPPPRPPFF